MNEETKKILREKTQVEMHSSDKTVVLEEIIGDKSHQKTSFFQNFALPAGLVATFLFAVLFFQSRPQVQTQTALDMILKDYFERELELDEITSDSFVYTDLQIDYE